MGAIRQIYKGRAKRINIESDSDNVEVSVSIPRRRKIIFNVSTDKEVTYSAKT